MPDQEISRTRLADLAEQAGVSTATVSRVLNGKPGVAAHTRQAVLAALDVLGYERSEKTRTNATELVGLVIPELTNPVFPAYAQALETRLSELGYTSVLCTQSPGGTTEEQYIERLTAHNVSGIVFVSGLHADTTASREPYHRLRAKGIPLVFINGYAEGIDAPFFSCNDAAAIQAASQHLRSLGHTKAGLAIGPTRFVPAQRKVDAFIECGKKAGVDVTDSIVTTFYTVEGGQAAALELLRTGHTAIICGSDLMALGAIRAIQAAGLRVPEDVSVVGFDDSQLISFTCPPLTTVRQPSQAIAQAAAGALLAEMSGNPVPRNELLFQPDLIVRDSTGAAPR